MPPRKRQKTAKTSKKSASASTSLMPSTSHLFELPAELRNRIWEYAVHSEHEIAPIMLPAKKGSPPRQKVYNSPQPIVAGGQPGITRACRQFRAEALPIYYSVNTFVLTNPRLERSTYSDHTAPHKWVMSIGKNVQYLRRVRIPFWSPHYLLISVLVTMNEAADRNSIAVIATHPMHPRAFYKARCDEVALRVKQGILRLLDSCSSDEALLTLWSALARRWMTKVQDGRPLTLFTKTTRAAKANDRRLD